MDFQKPLSVKDLSERFQFEVIGDDQLIATGINEIHKVRPGDITFVDIPKYYDKSLQSAASIILINQHVTCPDGKVLLVTEDPFAVYNQLVWEHRPMKYLNSDRGENLSIGKNTQIDHGVHIGHDVVIGDDCYIQPGVFIGDGTIIGDRVIIQAGALLGTDAFYFKKINGAYHKWRSGGRVVIGDDAEIGAGSTINRGVSGETIIGAGTKLDSQVHVGHGVVIGQHCLIAAQTGIGGKTIIGERCVIYGQVGIAQNLIIGKDSVILAKSGVSKSLRGAETYFGYPADIAREKFKEMARLRQLSGEDF
ncbi:MAG: UDP-3-O-(3-hydroxymyristoyl)glucosamine N-acyltransferase [Saprospiraceae bacterium]|jgi:UDP-3-O-[3-hydroxymyristoyl] glucosamine N-acyltransferase|nr:UDP-3-O-(3-hydroxymyristoyl)glucosamine N-acyltransferase [Saprospiraceae bacterium]